MSSIAMAGGGGGSSRTLLTASTNYYVTTTGSDSNTGSLAHPWLTLQHAMNVIGGTLDFAGFDITVNVGAGHFAGFVVVSCTGGGNLIFLGNGPGSSFIDSHNANFDMITNAHRMDTTVSLDGFTFKPPASNTVFNCLTGGVLFWGGAESFSSNNALDISAGGNNFSSIFSGNDVGSTIIIQGNVNFPTPTQVTGGTAIWGSFYQSFAGALIENFENWNFTGTPSFANAAFVNCQSFGLVIDGAETYTGTVSGPRVSANTASGILGFSLGALGTTRFPGTSFGKVDFSSTYDGFNFSNSITAPPTTTSLESASWGVFKDATHGQRYIALNDGGTIFVKQIGRSINTQTANYTLALTDQDGIVEMNLAGANTLTVPANATVAFPIGTEVRVVQVGAGNTTVAAAVGVTGDNFGALAGQWAGVTLYKRATDEWVMLT